MTSELFNNTNPFSFEKFYSNKNKNNSFLLLRLLDKTTKTYQYFISYSSGKIEQVTEENIKKHLFKDKGVSFFKLKNEKNGGNSNSTELFLKDNSRNKIIAKDNFNDFLTKKKDTTINLIDDDVTYNYLTSYKDILLQELNFYLRVKKQFKFNIIIDEKQFMNDDVYNNEIRQKMHELILTELMTKKENVSNIVKLNTDLIGIKSLLQLKEKLTLAKISELEAQIKLLTEQNTEMQSNNKLKDEEIKKLLLEIDQLKQSIQTLTDKFNVTQQLLENMQKEKDKLSNTINDTNTSQFELLQSTINELNIKIKSLTEELATITEKLKIKNNKIKELEFILATNKINNQDAITILREELNKAKQEIESLKKQIKEIQEQTDNEINDKKKEYETLILEKEKIISDFKTQIDALREQLTNTTKQEQFKDNDEKNRLLDEINRLEALLNTKSLDCKNLLQELQKIQQDANKIGKLSKNSLQELYITTSKIIEPEPKTDINNFGINAIGKGDKKNFTGAEEIITVPDNKFNTLALLDDKQYDPFLKKELNESMSNTLALLDDKQYDSFLKKEKNQDTPNTLALLDDNTKQLTLMHDIVKDINDKNLISTQNIQILNNKLIFLNEIIINAKKLYEDAIRIPKTDNIRLQKLIEQYNLLKNSIEIVYKDIKGQFKDIKDTLQKTTSESNTNLLQKINILLDNISTNELQKIETLLNASNSQNVLLNKQLEEKITLLTNKIDNLQQQQQPQPQPQPQQLQTLEEKITQLTDKVSILPQTQSQILPSQQQIDVTPFLLKFDQLITQRLKQFSELDKKFNSINALSSYMPQMIMPQMTMPQVTMPQMTMPQMIMPQMIMPQMIIPNLPHIESLSQINQIIPLLKEAVMHINQKNFYNDLLSNSILPQQLIDSPNNTQEINILKQQLSDKLNEINTLKQQLNNINLQNKDLNDYLLSIKKNLYETENILTNILSNFDNIIIGKAEKNKNNNMFNNIYDAFLISKEFIGASKKQTNINKNLILTESFNNNTSKLLVYLKNFENILYKENNGIKDNNLNNTEFLNMYDSLRHNVEQFIDNKFTSILANNSINNLKKLLFFDKTNAIIIDNFKNLFYNVMLNNFNKNSKYYKFIKKEINEFLSYHISDNTLRKNYSELLLINIIDNFNKAFSKLYPNKKNINYLYSIHSHKFNELKNIIKGGDDNDIESLDNKENDIHINNNVLIYFLILINLIIFFILFKIINYFINNTLICTYNI